MSIFKNTTGGENAQLMTAMHAEVKRHVIGDRSVDKNLVQTTVNLGLESADSSQRNELASAVKDFRTWMCQTVESVFNDPTVGGAKKKATYTQEQYAAATAAYVLAANPKAHFTAQRLAPSAQPDTHFINAGDSVPYQAEVLKTGLEAYDNSARDGMIANSIVYNLNASRQDEFSDAFFRPITLTPDMFGITIEVPLIQLQNEIKRSITGDSQAGFDRKNLIKAAIDPSVLQTELTKCVPVLRSGAENKFVDATDVAPHDVVLEGQTVTTAPLRVDTEIDLIGLSATDELLKTGILDQTDALDSLIQISALYIKVPDATDAAKFDVVKLSGLENITSATFIAATTGLDRRMTVSMKSTAPVVSELTKRVDGTPLSALKIIADKKYTVRLDASAYGEANLEFGTIKVTGASVAVASIKDENGEVVPFDKGIGKGIADLFASAKVIGYDQNSRRTNSNRRQRGQLLNISSEKFIYGTMRRSPITVAKPQVGTNLGQHADLAALIYTTNLRACANAVDKLLSTEAFLEEHVRHNADHYALDNEGLGAARRLVTPFYEKITIDMLTDISFSNDKDRYEAIYSILVNKMRDLAYRMYRDTGYKAAADALNGGVSQPPVLIIGTDPVISRFLMQQGDLRTVGPDFPAKLVYTLNIKMTGKIILTFAENGEGAANSPLNFGNFIWKPELVTELPTMRNGANSNELTVQPDFNHVVNLPIMASIDVKNLHEIVMGRIPMAVETENGFYKP
jgi:hypothetical protein